MSVCSLPLQGPTGGINARYVYLLTWQRLCLIPVCGCKFSEKHACFNYFRLDNIKNSNTKSKNCEGSSSQRLGHQSMSDSLPQLLKCLFYLSMSDILLMRLDEILSWLTWDKMKYCKMNLLFLYLVIRGGHVTVYLTVRNLLQASLQPHMASLKSINQICISPHLRPTAHVLGCTKQNSACTHTSVHTCLRQPQKQFAQVMEIALWRLAIVCVVAWLCLSASLVQVWQVVTAQWPKPFEL